MRRALGEIVVLTAAAVLLLASTAWVIAVDSPTGGLPGSARTSQTPAPKADWAPAPPSDPLSPDRDPKERGRALFLTKGCAGCHATAQIAATVPVGPDLTRLPARARHRVPGLSAEAYVCQSLLDPQAFIVPEHRRLNLIGQMPRLHLDEREVAALVAFLLTDEDQPAR